MKTRTTAEAFARLHAGHETEIQLARQVARELCREHGSTNSRLVRLEMERRGLISRAATKVHWFGCIFRTAEFIATGERVSYSSTTVHEREIKVWRLRSPSSSSGGEHKSAPDPTITPTSGDGGKPSSGSGALVAPRSKAEALPCMQLDLLGASR